MGYELSGARKLAMIFGTEDDRVNCPFYYKIGACRHGDECSRTHNVPTTSSTLLLPHLYAVPPEAVYIAEGHQANDDTLDRMQAHYEDFFVKLFRHVSDLGEVEDIVVLDNISQHLLGNTYINHKCRYKTEQAAEQAKIRLQESAIYGRSVTVHFCPVTDFRDARCRQYSMAKCGRGGYCNFMHAKHFPSALMLRLKREMYDKHPYYRTSSVAPSLRIMPTDVQRDENARRKMIEEWNKELNEDD